MSNNKKSVGFFVGIIASLIVLFLPESDGLAPEAQRAAAIFVLMGIWWATEAVPIAITALIPLVFFPLLGVASIEATAAPYANKNIFLFLGGFFLSLAIQKCNLHKRIALTILKFTGTRGKSIIAGFMVSSCLLSMWIMNTSTTIMLLPIGLAIIAVVKESMTELSELEKLNFQVALLLGIAYAANIGGIATLIGTAPNMALNGFMEEQYNVSISFLDWMKVGVPVSLTLLPLAWLSLTRLSFPVNFQTSEQTQATIINMRHNRTLSRETTANGGAKVFNDQSYLITANYTHRGGFTIPVPFFDNYKVNNQVNFTFNFDMNKNRTLQKALEATKFAETAFTSSWKSGIRLTYSFSQSVSGSMIWEYRESDSMHTGKKVDRDFGFDVNLAIRG